MQPWADADMGDPVQGAAFSSRILLQNKQDREQVRSFASQGKPGRLHAEHPAHFQQLIASMLAQRGLMLISCSSCSCALPLILMASTLCPFCICWRKARLQQKPPMQRQLSQPLPGSMHSNA